MIYVTSSTSVKYFMNQVKSYRKHKKGSWNHVIDYNFTKENQDRQGEIKEQFSLQK